jgi:arabinan endo-1,5-alpha-L-arabinosidase
MKNRWLTLSITVGLAVGGSHWLGKCCMAEGQSSTSSGPRAYQLTGDAAGTHDPSIIKDGDTWYVFASGKDPNGGHIPIRCSTDLVHWKHCGSVFPKLPDWLANDPQVPHTEGIWAPDISYFDGKFHLYYAYSLFGRNTSGIGLATNVTLNPNRPDYKWVDEGLVLRSVASDDFNAIDPNLVIDKAGQTWLDFGSFWTGIKMRQIDRTSGKLSSKDQKLYSMASRAKPEHPAPAPPNLPADWQAVEAPFIVMHGDYYYLFVSWDLCCRGVKSTYRTMVGRARSITGPYLDKEGVPMTKGGGGELLTGNATWLGPGGESVHVGSQNDADFIVYHAYDAITGKPSLQISTLTWADGWPRAALASSANKTVEPK